MGWTLEPYQDQNAAGVVDLWNEEFGHALPLSTELLLHRWRIGPNELATGWVACQRSELLGAILVRLPARPWFPAGVGFVTLFVVARRARRQGIGQALLAQASRDATRHGYRVLVFGGGPGHLVPGIPLEAPLTTWRFLRRSGAFPREVFHDLLVDLTVLPVPPSWPDGVTLEPAPRDEMLAFLAREFPGEWEVDVAEAYEAGATVLGLRRDGKLIGFAAAHPPGSWPPPPSLFWAPVLSGPVGGLGPLGIAATHRKQGFGLAMVRGALAFLRDTGARWAVIDWTELAAFYGRAGAHVWRTYQMAALPLS
ncbi:GNAT family N-acetyltransferase [Thermomicrobium sp. 4228-Ro]|uniref:GNAT family N-acetyltransferase n=1 Tax=Thermomicrobium sp. 4228-Ro TaxID=2993937 RepID=UPI0022493908|nr:GNAT family N-acetyltransferase [Thermomicrobium sp. 4228-Ro]MCX2727232.1 GNAT family N-acetyltransferase [Thermomicrobium sp. 4228-Ro]